MTSLLGWGALIALVVKNVKMGLLGGSLSFPTFCLIAAILLSDILLLANKERLALSRSSQGFALAGILFAPGVGMWTIVAHLLGTLILSSGSARTWLNDVGVCTAPLAITALLYGQFDSTAFTVFGSTQLFLFLTLTFQPQDLGLKTSFFTELGAPALAIGALAVAQTRPLFLFLFIPLALGLSKAGDKNLDLLRKMHGALTRSQDRLKRGSAALKESKKKLSQSETLLGASRELASTLSEVELRKIAGRYFQGLGIDRYRFSEKPSPDNPKVVQYDLGESLGYVMLQRTENRDAARGAEVLVRLLAVNLQNARLHSRIVEAMQRLKESQAQLISQNQLAAVGRLSAGVAHEVNTPLGAIKLSVESGLLSLEKDPAKARPKLERALKAVEKASRSVERLLYYSKPSDAQPPKLFHPHIVLGDCLELLSHRFKRHRLEIDVQIQTEAPLYGVEHAFYEMASNLLLNASEAVERGEGRRMRVVLSQSDKTVVLTVEDSGPGVPEELRGKIFESFFTTKGSGRGTGLGLHLVKEVAIRFGGTVEVGASPELGGAMFVVRLPGKG